jgi:hypothetical protein
VPLADVPQYAEHDDFVTVYFNAFVADEYTVPVYGHSEDHTEIPILPVPTVSTFDDVAANDLVVPEYITKSEYGRLRTYAGQWHIDQGRRRCQATCAGSRTQIDVQGPAGPLWSCDSDDLLCPQDNTQNELQGILDAIKNSGQVHANCPKTNPCLVVPPPCYYVSTECIPQNVLDYTLNNTSIRDNEEGTDADYLHTPLAKDDITQVKLVSGQWPLGNVYNWPYARGIPMTPVTGRDGNSYYKTCTYALTMSGTSAGVSYGFSLSNSENNHVYDSGHVQAKEMWQRYYGETVSPGLSSACTERQAGGWDNRIQYHTPDLQSRTYVFGSCAKQCAAVLGSVPHEEIVAPFQLSQGVLRARLAEARAMGKSNAELNLITAEVLEQRMASSLGTSIDEIDQSAHRTREKNLKMRHNGNFFGASKRASLGEAERSVEARDTSRRPRRDSRASLSLAHVLASASVLVLIGLVVRYDAIKNNVRERRERRTEEGIAERAALLV